MNNNTELLELQDRYNRICNELKQLISSVLESGKKTPEEAVRLSQLQEEEQILYAELKQLGLLSNQLDKKAIIDILTDYGQSTLLKLEEDGSITIGGDKIPQLVLLAKTIDLIAKLNDEQSKIELTPQFIEMIVEKTGGEGEGSDLYTKYQQLADKFTWLIKSGTSQSTMQLTDKLFELISQNITLTAEHINLNGYINANGGNFSVDEQGNIEANDLNVHGTLTCKDINVTKIIAPSAPEGLTNSMRIDINEGVSISETLDDLPINLNGYSVNIYLNTDVAENIELRRHYAGLVNIFLCGYNLKGTIRGNFNNSAYGIYGGNSESDTTNLGAIMPYEGYKIGSYYYSVSMVNCPNVSIKNVTIYGGATNTTYTVGIGGTRKSIIELDNITFKNCASNCRTYSMAEVYCAKSSGTSTKVGWYAGTGSTIMLNSSNQAGGSPNTNKANNSQLYADGVTFDGNGTTVTPPVDTPHTTTRTATFKPVSGGTYRYTLYNNWRKDNVVRQGKWGTTSGNCAGAWFYGSQFDEVQGKNITKVVISVSRSEGVGNSASCAHSFQAHPHISRPSGEPNFTTCNKSISLSWGQSGTITITDEAVLTGISEGTIKGFGIKSAFDGAHYSALSNGTVKIYYTE